MRRSVPFLLLLAPLVGGCANSHGSMMEFVEAGAEHEMEARRLEKRREYPPAAERFGLSQVELDQALAIAKHRRNQVFTSFITTKLSIVSSGQARCVEPKNNPQGSWERARALYVQAGAYADEITLLKLKANALVDEARCTQPDHDPQGSWERAAAVFAQAAAVCEGMKDDVGRGAALRQQALCLMQGDPGAMTPEARELLVRARKLGDERAAELLTDAGAVATFCKKCGADRPGDDRFCPQCGADQTEPSPEDQPKDEPVRGPRSAENPTGQVGPGGPMGSGPR